MIQKKRPACRQPHSGQYRCDTLQYAISKIILSRGFGEVKAIIRKGKHADRPHEHCAGHGLRAAKRSRPRSEKQYSRLRRAG